jgi:hypothetical protein
MKIKIKIMEKMLLIFSKVFKIYNLKIKTKIIVIKINMMVNKKMKNLIKVY